jgi:sugar lactone lactonase YvrE
MTLARKTLALLSAITLFTFALSVCALAEGTRTWEQSKFEELTKGTAKGIALRSEGGLELAPAFKALATTPSTYIWSIASDSVGNIYAAAGSPARVYRITPDGQSATIFEPQELQVQALVVDKKGIVYAATAPDGKVYRLEETRATSAKAGAKSWSATPYFDPGTKYIWDIVLDNSGALYVATGDHGEIYKVSANGQHSLFFKSDEVHIRVLALDPKGNLIAGSDGSGLVYRIAPNGEAFVLYSAPKKEITALAIDGAGNIYAAAAGEKRPGGTNPGMGIALSSPAQTSSAPGGTLNAPAASTTPTSPFPAPGLGATGGSEIYRIAPDGAPSRWWSSHEDLVYALAFDQHGRLIAGTGNRGHIFAINGVDDFTDLIKASATQITAFAAAPGGGIYASGSNLGKIFVLGPGPESEGTYESDVFDARVFSLWGRVSIRSAGNSNVELYARSGNVDNPDRNWSPWTRINFALAAGSELKIPPARFVQWKSVLHAGNPAPRVDAVLLNYLPKNVAPEIDEITVQPGYRYQPISHVTGSEPPGQGQGQPRFDPPPPAVRDRDAIGIRWSAHDDNDDQLVYTVYYRGDGESRWLLLKNNLPDRYYSFDASLLPDGGYTVKVVASDAPSHSPGEALYAERVGTRFEVDTTPPVIDNLTATLDVSQIGKQIDSKQIDGKQIKVHFRASDSFSSIKRAEYSLDGGDWQFVEPVGQLSDSKAEDYDFRVAVPQLEAAPALMAGNTASDHVVVVRAYDRFDNLATAKTVIRGK